MISKERLPNLLIFIVLHDAGELSHSESKEVILSKVEAIRKKIQTPSKEYSRLLLDISQSLTNRAVTLFQDIETHSLADLAVKSWEKLRDTEMRLIAPDHLTNKQIATLQAHKGAIESIKDKLARYNN